MTDPIHDRSQGDRRVVYLDTFNAAMDSQARQISNLETAILRLEASMHAKADSEIQAAEARGVERANHANLQTRVDTISTRFWYITLAVTVQILYTYLRK